jgi:hypothetical protein
VNEHGFNAYEKHLFRTREMLRRQQEKEALKRHPYKRLPPGHPDFDTEDLPHWWQRWAIEGATAAALAAVIFTVAVLAQPLGPILPNFLDWLTELTR